MALLEQLEDEMTCPIHLEVFEEPMQLKCLHVLCKSDVDSLTRPNNLFIQCPQCKQLSSKGDIRRDFRMQRLLDIYHTRKDKLKNGKKCEACDGDVATAWCFDCSVHLCQRCETSHLRLPISAKHKVDTIANVMAFKEKRKTEITGMVGRLQGLTGSLDRFKSEDDMVLKARQGMQNLQATFLKLHSEMSVMYRMFVDEHNKKLNQANDNIRAARVEQIRCDLIKQRLQDILQQNSTKVLLETDAAILSQAKSALDRVTEQTNTRVAGVNEWSRVVAENNKIINALHQIVRQGTTQVQNRKRSLSDAVGSSTNASEPKAKVDRPSTSSDPTRSQGPSTGKVVSSQPQPSTSANTPLQRRPYQATLKTTGK